MPYRVVLFDLDGTLVDSIELILRAADYAFTDVMGTAPPREEILAGIGKPLMTQFGAYATDRDQLDRLIQSYRVYQLAHHDDLTRPYDGVNDLVGVLAGEGRSLGVVTSKIESLAHRALDHVGLKQHFSIVVGIESTTRHKPDPDPLIFALQQLGARRDEAIYVGDSPFDLQAARAAGMDSCAVTWGAFSEEQLLRESPTSLARNASELQRLLS